MTHIQGIPRYVWVLKRYVVICPLILEKKFLKFFLSRVKINRKENCEEWPYVSPCGDEMNYIKCDDLPVVFQTIIYGMLLVFYQLLRP